MKDIKNLMDEVSMIEQSAKDLKNDVNTIMKKVIAEYDQSCKPKGIIRLLDVVPAAWDKVDCSGHIESVKYDRTTFEIKSLEFVAHGANEDWTGNAEPNDFLLRYDPVELLTSITETLKELIGVD